MVFIDSEKTYDKISREVIRHVVKNKHSYKWYIDNDERHVW